MSERDGKRIKQAIIAALCEHPEAEKYRQRAFSGDNMPDIIVAMSQQPHTLTKADFLAQDDDGKFLLDSAGAWKNFDKIIKILQENGEQFTYDDFMKPLVAGSQKSLLDSARIHGGLSKIFTFEAWHGRFEEMERLWYKVSVPDRKNLFKNLGDIPSDLKIRMFAAEGKVTPEERLAKAGLSPADIRAAFGAPGNLDDINNKLQLVGDYLRKEYVMMTDVFGDTVFDSRLVTWDKYGLVVQIMKAHGERFEVADIVRKVSYVSSILGRAAEHRVLDKVFTDAHWVDRLPEMLTLWAHVLDGWKTASMTTRDFDSAYAKAESMTYAKHFAALRITGKADLLKPLNEGAKTEKPVLPLGLRAVWEAFDSVQKALGGDKLTIADLRAPTGEMGNSCLICAAKYGCFDKIVEMSRQGGGMFAMEDFLSKDSHGNMLVNLLAEKNQLALAFAPDIWAGRVSEMKMLWSQVRAEHRQQVDFRQAEVAARQATLKQKKVNVHIHPKPPKP